MDPASGSSKNAAPGDSAKVSSLQSVMDITSRPMWNRHGQSSFSHYRYNLGRSMFLRQSHNHYGNQYYRRVGSNNTDKLNVHRTNGAPFFEDRHCFRSSGHCNAETRHHEDNRGKGFQRPERIRFNAMLVDSTTSDVLKMVCGICLKLLRRKLSSSLGNTMPSSELSVVAVLACGHAYHANCLEERTTELDKRDPFCPACVNTPLKVDTALERK